MVDKGILVGSERCPTFGRVWEQTQSCLAPDAFVSRPRCGCISPQTRSCHEPRSPKDIGLDSIAIISLSSSVIVENCKARVAYLNGSKAIEAPPVELIQFVDSKIHKEQSDLFTTSISEVCFYTDDIDSVYKTLIENHVECLSEPQHFDFRADGFGESRAFYFRDPDGIILEMMQPL